MKYLVLMMLVVLMKYLVLMMLVLLMKYLVLMMLVVLMKYLVLMMLVVFDEIPSSHGTDNSKEVSSSDDTSSFDGVSNAKFILVAQF